MRHILFISCFHEACTIINEALSDLFASAKLSLIIMLMFTMTYLCILYLPEGCVCVYLCAFLGRENCISIGNQLSTHFRKNKLRSWWKRRVCTSVCVTGLRPPPYTICLSHVKLSATVAYYLCVYPPDVSICQRIHECVSYLCHDSMMITGNWYFAFIIMRLLNLFFCLLTCIINVQFYH